MVAIGGVDAPAEEAPVQLDLDELWPDSASLVGMRFDSDEGFRQAQAILWAHPDVYHWVWEQSRTIAVRKADVRLFPVGGLAYTKVEIVDPPAIPTEAERQLERQGLKRAMAWWLKELGWAK
jgi:hypothetical protein